MTHNGIGIRKPVDVNEIRHFRGLLGCDRIKPELFIFLIVALKVVVGKFPPVAVQPIFQVGEPIVLAGQNP